MTQLFLQLQLLQLLKIANYNYKLPLPQHCRTYMYYEPLCMDS